MTQVDEQRVAPEGGRGAVLAARDEGYAFFDWLSAVDETDAEEGEGLPGPGLEVICHLLDVSRTREGAGLRGLRLRTRVPAGGSLPSVTGVFRGAAWHERELAEMFGLEVDGFDDGTGLGLRPLLLPEGFEGHPLRKDYPLRGRGERESYRVVDRTR